jgi:DNA ligase (NAD+)
MTTETLSIERMIEIMNSPETKNWIDKFILNHYGDINLNDEEKIKLKEIIDMANTIYNYSGSDTGISDETYDILYEKLELSNDSDNSITTPIINNKLKVGYHKYKSLRGTLDKIYYLSEEDGKDVANQSRRGLPEWVESSQRKIRDLTGNNINLWDEEVYVFPKWDGVSCIFEFSKDGKLERALTRGFTETNEAQIVTHIFEDSVVGPWTNRDHPYGIKTEIMMSEDDLMNYNAIYNTTYKNSRSIVSSIMNSDEKDNRVKYLQIMSLRMSEIINGEESLQSLTPGAFNGPFLRCRLKDIDRIKEFAFAHKYVNGLRCDGAVIYIINENIQKLLGRENNKQKFEVAFKFTEETGYSKVKNINFTIGLFGRINPVLEIKPIKLKGNTITNISLGSFSRFKELKLAEDDKVKVLYDIIPYCVFDESDDNCKRSGKPPFTAPEFCPACGEPLTTKIDVSTKELAYHKLLTPDSTEDGSILYCNNKECPCRKKGKILNYFNKMHIDGISYATVDVLYDEGYLKSIQDIYKLKSLKKSLIKIPGFGDQSVNLILDAIDANREVTDAQFLGSLGIESVSQKTFEKVLSEIPYDTLIDECINGNLKDASDMLCLVKGISDITANKIIFGLREAEDLIMELEDELILIPYKSNKDNFKVCFTKIRDENLEKIIIALGGQIVDSVTKDTNLVIVPLKGVESSKVTKASKYGIPVIPIEESEGYIREHFVK